MSMCPYWLLLIHSVHFIQLQNVWYVAGMEQERGVGCEGGRTEREGGRVEGRGGEGRFQLSPFV